MSRMRYKFLTLLVLAVATGLVAAIWLSGDFGRQATNTIIASSPQLLQSLQANFDKATLGKSGAQTRMDTMPRNTFAGIVCNPARINSSAPGFRIVLPKRFEDRKGALAAITPAGSLHYVYVSYGIDTDPEDLIIPSQAIDWERARTQNVFQVDANQFDALAREEDMPQRLLREAGVYQFAIINTNDRSLLDINGGRFQVKSGCVVHWQP